jgi:hypothetical protein
VSERDRGLDGINDKAAPLAGRLREPASAAYQQHAPGY